MLVLSADANFGALVQAQVDNLGCATNLALTYDEGSTKLAWAEAAVVDLAGDGLDDLYGLRVEAPMLRILAIAPDEERAEAARSAGVNHLLVEPFSITDIGAAVRALDVATDNVVDLRDHATQPEQSDESKPWWATR